MILDDAQIDALLARADTQAPCGPNLEYDPQFLALERAASGRPAHAIGAVAVAAVPPDWLEVHALATDLLRRSKDIRVAIFLGRAAIGMDGIVGIRGAVDLVHRMLEQHWHCIHPQLEDIQGDSTARLNAIAGLADPETMLPEVRAALVIASRNGERVTVRDVVTASSQLQPARLQDVVALGSLEHLLAQEATYQSVRLEAGRDLARSLAALQDYLRRTLGPNAAAILKPLAELLMPVAVLCERVWAELGRRAEESPLLELIAQKRLAPSDSSAGSRAAVIPDDFDPFGVSLGAGEAATGIPSAPSASPVARPGPKAAPDRSTPLPATKRAGEPAEQEQLMQGPYFKVYHPLAMKPEQWASLLVYLHSSKREAVEGDSARRLGDAGINYVGAEDGARVDIERGAEVTIVPAIAGCRFNPQVHRVAWLEDVQVAEFRMQASPAIAGYAEGQQLRGIVRLYVGPLLVGELPVWTVVQRSSLVDPSLDAGHAVRPLTQVFVSYSHKDGRIVDSLERAYQLVRIDYLRDVRLLRSGDQWNPAILQAIEQADRFQLCWSQAAKESPFVEQEWRRALQVRTGKDPQFICPFYWAKPMPAPPTELSDLHFAYLELFQV